MLKLAAFMFLFKIKKVFIWDVIKTSVAEFLKENFFFGVGYGNIDLQLPSWVKTDNPDNQYFDIWLQNGFIAFISFIIILFVGFKRRNSIFKIESNILNSSFALLIFGGITWAFISGYGILLFSVLVGIASFYHPYFRKENLTITNENR